MKQAFTEFANDERNSRINFKTIATFASGALLASLTTRAGLRKPMG